MSESYRDLEIYRSSLKLFFAAHTLTMKLPKHELYELGSQLRRSASSVSSNIVEGYGRRKYKAEYVRFLVFSHASELESYSHLEKLSVVYPEFSEEISQLRSEYDRLGRMIYGYIQYVEKEWRT